MELTPKSFAITLLVFTGVIFGAYQWGSYEKASLSQGNVQHIQQLMEDYKVQNEFLRTQRDSALAQANRYYIQKELLKKSFKLGEATDRLDEAADELMRRHTETEKDSIENEFIEYLRRQQN